MDERDPARTDKSWDAYQPQTPRWSTLFMVGVLVVVVVGALALLVWSFDMGVGR